LESANNFEDLFAHRDGTSFTGQPGTFSRPLDQCSIFLGEVELEVRLRDTEVEADRGHCGNVSRVPKPAGNLL
jgi:hypothetical protein